MTKLEIKYFHYGKKPETFLGQSQGIDIEQGSLIYWMLDKYIQYRLKKDKKYREAEYQKAKENFDKFKNMI